MIGLPATMWAMAMTAFGGPQHLAMLELPMPVPGPDEVLIRVHTVAANRQDTFTMAGRAQVRHPVALPHVLGIDPAGVVVATGAAVQTPTVGARVVVKPSVACATCPTCLAGEDDACPAAVNIGVHRAGGMAEYVAVPASNAFSIPDGLDFVAATAIAHSFPVALQMLRERVVLQRGESVLVTGAGGAIGAASVQLAKALGATVVAAAGGPDRVDYVRGLGADAVIDYAAQPGFAPAVRAVVPDGVDVYVESAGDPDIWTEALAALGRRGRVVVCGSHAGGEVGLDLNWLFRTRASILGSSGSSLRIMGEVLAMAGRGDIVANVHSVLPLERAADAFAILFERRNRGKVVLSVAAQDD